MIVSIAKAQALSIGGAVASGNSGTPNIGSLGSPSLGNPTRLTIAFETDTATTVNINVSFDDGKTWIPATLDGSSAIAAPVLAAPGGIAVSISPAPYVQLVVSAACKITAWAYTS